MQTGRAGRPKPNGFAPDLILSGQKGLGQAHALKINKRRVQPGQSPICMRGANPLVEIRRQMHGCSELCGIGLPSAVDSARTATASSDVIRLTTSATDGSGVSNCDGRYGSQSMWAMSSC